jgi:DNA-directed RNA polymerase subunit N (RpoN/RPB10)
MKPAREKAAVIVAVTAGEGVEARVEGEAVTGVGVVVAEGATNDFLIVAAASECFYVLFTRIGSPGNASSNSQSTISLWRIGPIRSRLLTSQHNLVDSEKDMPSKLLPFAFCRECCGIVAYEIGEHEGSHASQPVRCRACGSAITVLYDDGENASCGDCGEIVPCLINHPASTDTHRVEQVTCVCCNREIITFHSGNAASKQNYRL